MRLWVKNLTKTSDKDPKEGGSWLEFWKIRSGKRIVFCSNRKCLNTVAVGAHVKLHADYKDGKHYIVPLCDACNKISSDEHFEIDSVLIEAESR